MIVELKRTCSEPQDIFARESVCIAFTSMPLGKTRIISNTVDCNLISWVIKMLIVLVKYLGTSYSK